MNNKNYTIIDKSDIMDCWRCEGKGKIRMLNLINFLSQEIPCPLCNGNGKFRESHYVIVDEVNKIAIDSDCGG